MKLALHAGTYTLSVGLSSVADTANTEQFSVPTAPVGRGVGAASPHWVMDPAGRGLAY